MSHRSKSPRDTKSEMTSLPAIQVLSLFLCTLFSHCLTGPGSASKSPACRNIPDSAGYPNAAAWNAFNSTVSGRLVNVVPSAKYCRESVPGGACTDTQWTSAVFRNTIPGAMEQVNWEQGYDLTPPSLCLQNGTTCGQGDVPLYSVEAQTVADIQAAVKFASTHNLRLVVKSSGHDYLGRSTAPGSLLIRTTHLQNISFTDAFFVGSQNMGSAVTLGSGVPAQSVYQQAKLNGKITVSPVAATVCNAGGWVQGAGHSALSPKFGLGADNVLEFYVVVASGELLQVNSISNPDLFYALRGGGAGSWGVIVSATFKTYPTFNATSSTILLVASNDSVVGALATLHAQHIFDLDSIPGGQYFYFVRNGTAADSASYLYLNTYLPNTTTSQSTALLAPFLNASLALPGVSILGEQSSYGDINDALYQVDDSVGANEVLGSRLIPAETYRDPTVVGEVYRELFSSGTTIIGGHLVAGGQVAENANIYSAVNPAWRSAKTHVLIVNEWPDATSIEDIDALRKHFQTQQLPIFEKMSGPDAGSYSNEADVLEPHFETTFFGPNYAKLSQIKSKYDPEDLFIVGAGVGSERWDEWGICRI
ncbi:FAD-binding domain-containing protein [Mycena maculata]|uniref:FAD-binding domain-containing protein n=1 Tax=Mycena maculata TaxID=230809 RepID=A0AAD7HNK9_9AGAR|nr:FAD-binding domain-containing protein [Mycena maculata]